MKRVVYDNPAQVGAWVCARTGGTFSLSDAWAIGLERDGELVAGVIYDHYNGASVAMHVAGEGKNWLNREFLSAAFFYPFGFLKVRKIIGLVDAANSDARKFDEHLGFRVEAVLKDCAPNGDLLLYTMTPDQCRYLKG